jgi:hypothetical protein
MTKKFRFFFARKKIYQKKKVKMFLLFLILIFCGCEDDIFQRDKLTGSHRIDITDIRKVVIGENHGRVTIYGENVDDSLIIIDKNHGTIADDFGSNNIFVSQVMINGVVINGRSSGVISYEITENYGRIDVNGDITCTRNHAHAYIESNGDVKGDNNHGSIDINGDVTLKENNGRISANGDITLKRNKKEISVNGDVWIEDSNEENGYIDANGNVRLNRNIGDIQVNGKVTLNNNEEGGFIRAHKVDCQEDNGTIEIIKSNVIQSERNVQCEGSMSIINNQIICH